MKLFNLFGKPEHPDSRDLEQVIFDIAEHRADKDFHVLYRLMARRQVYVPVDPSTLPRGAVPGERHVVTASDRLHMRFVDGPNKERLVPAATREDASLLRSGYVGMEWTEFLRMVMNWTLRLMGCFCRARRRGWPSTANASSTFFRWNRAKLRLRRK